VRFVIVWDAVNEICRRRLVMTTIDDVRTSVFDHIVCAVDGSEGSLEAVKQANVLGNGRGTIDLVGVFTPSLAQVSPAELYSPYGAPLEVAEEERDFTASVMRGRDFCPTAAVEVLQGPAYARLLEHLEESDVTLVAVGGSGRARPLGIVLGSVPTGLLHSAPCSVLVARRPWASGSSPQSIIVGWDGSPESIAAVRVGQELVERLGASLRVIAARGASWEPVADLADVRIDWDNRDPVEALRDASQSADLLLLGSRGLHGIKAIGSVSEKLGHVSACSVLVVRDRPER
jgi:nucleotide-binding universal stress UspA family protein